MIGSARLRGAWPKFAVAALVAAAVVGAILYVNAPEATKIPVGATAPDMELVSENGGVQRLSVYRGQAVLLVFFMSDCHICQKDIPDLELVNREFRNQGLAVLGVSVDRDYTTYKRFILDNKLSFGMYRDPGGSRILEAFGSYRLPESYLIDQGGVVRAIWLGEAGFRTARVREKILEILKKK
jgi:peroxiredoxin